MTRTALRTALRLVLVGLLLTYPLGDLLVLRRIYPQTERIELAMKAESTALANGELERGPSGETRRAVAYRPGDPAGVTATSRFMRWFFRVLALMIALQLFIGRRGGASPSSSSLPSS